MSRPEQNEAQRWFLSTPDGTVDLRTGRLLKARVSSPGRVAGVSPRAGDSGAWREVLQALSGGDTVQAERFQRAVGASLAGGLPAVWATAVLTPNTELAKLALLALCEALGDYALSVREPAVRTWLATGAPRRAPLRGVRLTVLVDSPLSALNMPACQLWQALGAIGTLWSVESGPAPAGVHTVRLDGPCQPGDLDTLRRVYQRLHAERPAILAWAIDGCLGWQAHGLSPVHAAAPADPRVEETAPAPPPSRGAAPLAARAYRAQRAWYQRMRQPRAGSSPG